MSNEAVGQFFASVYDDKSLQGALNYALVAASPETVVEIAKKKGYDITVDDLKAVLQESEEELSEAELENVAGGRSLSPGLLGVQALKTNFWGRFSQFGGASLASGFKLTIPGPSFVLAQAYEGKQATEKENTDATAPSAVDIFQALMNE